MDITDFDAHVRSNPDTLTLARDLAADYERRGLSEGQQQYTVGLDALVGLAIYVLYRYANDRLNHERAQDETDIAERRARLIGEMVGQGFAPEKARALVEGVLTQIEKRTEKDLPLQKIIALLNPPGPK